MDLRLPVDWIPSNLNIWSLVYIFIKYSSDVAHLILKPMNAQKFGCAYISVLFMYFGTGGWCDA